MKKFNKFTALKKLDNKNNIKTKQITVIVSVVVLVFAIIFFSFARFEAINTYSLINGIVNKQRISLIDKIIDLKTNGNTDLEYDGTATLGTNGTDDNNLRYVGANPNNYVYFNCSTTIPSEMNDNTCEKWRIIGLFNNVEDDLGNALSSVKIIRNESIGDYAWDTSVSSINNGYGINQWGESGTYEGADLMRELNTDYLGNITVGTDGKWYDNSNDSKATNKPSSTLNSNAQNMIRVVKWNTGSDTNAGNSTWTAKNMYSYEQSENIGKICSSSTSCNDSVVRTTNWTGKVALMYPSDYGYATSGGTTTNKETCLNTSLYSWNGSGISDCKNNSWIYQSGYWQWTLSPRAGSSNAYYSFRVDSDGHVSDSRVGHGYDVHPTVFLKSLIYITGGNGSSTSPYKLEYKPNVVDTLTLLKSNGATDLEYDGTSTLGEYGTNDNNLRYIGANPSNYIYFNCSTTNASEMNDETCEKWRIIGVFNNVENENENKGSRVKIIRDEDLGEYYVWNSCPYTINSGRGSNQWGESTYTNGSVYEGSYLMLELNTDYLGNITIGTDGKWYSSDSMAKNTMPTTSLNEEAQRMIQVAKWNTGTFSSSIRLNDILYGQLYNIERSTNVPYNVDDIVRTTSWIGKVALPYPSDFAYATSGTDSVSRSECLGYSVSSWTCSSSNWLSYNYNYWTITPAYNYDNSIFRDAFRVTYYKSIQTDGTHMANKIRPALYLKDNLRIVNGDGTSTNPYKLVID